MGEALAMAQMAVSQGTDTIVATPHRSWSLRIPPHPHVIQDRVNALQAELNWAQIPLTLVAGLEIKINSQVAQDLEDGVIGTLGTGSRWALVELPFDHIPHDALDHFKAVRDAGYEIVLAHPERYPEIRHNPLFLQSCADLGIAFQITSGSLLGRFGPRAQAAAEALLHRADEWPLVIASDSHDLRDRSTALLYDARNAAAAIVGFDAAQEMVDSRPRAMISEEHPEKSP